MPRSLLAAVVALLALPSAALAADFADTARNVVPSGQWGGVPVPPGADSQAKLYDSLTPRFDQVTAADLTTLVQVRALRRRPGRSREGRARAAPRRAARARPLQRPAHHRAQARRRHVGDGLGARGGSRAAAGPGPLPGAPRRRGRPQHQRVRPRHRAEDLHPDAPGRAHDPPQRPARPALRRPGRQGPAARHRRLRRRHQRAAAEGEEHGQAVHSRGPVRDQRAGRADLRRGRGRGEPPRPVPRRAAPAPRRRARAAAVRRPLRAHRRRHADDLDPHDPVRARAAHPDRQRDPRRRQPAAHADRRRERERGRARRRTGRATSRSSVASARPRAIHCSSADRRSATSIPTSRSRPTCAGPATRPAASTRPPTQERS